MAEGISTDDVGVAQILATMELTKSATLTQRRPENIAEAYKIIFQVIRDTYAGR